MPNVLAESLQVLQLIINTLHCEYLDVKHAAVQDERKALSGVFFAQLVCRRLLYVEQTDLLCLILVNIRRQCWSWV